MINSQWRTVVAPGSAGAAEMLFSLAGRRWGILLLNTTLLVSIAASGVGVWLVANIIFRDQSGKWNSRLRWVVGILAGNVVGLLALEASLSVVIRFLTQICFTPSGFYGYGVMITDVYLVLLLVSLAPLVAGAVGAWIAGQPRGPLAALTGALSGLYALSIATSSAGVVVAGLVTVLSAAGGLAVRCTRSQERAWPYLLSGAVVGGGLIMLLLIGALAVASSLAVTSSSGTVLALTVLALTVAAPVVGGIVSATIARRAYIRAGLLSCVLPAPLAMIVIILSDMSHDWKLVLLPIGGGAIAAGLGGLLVRLTMALQRRISPFCVLWLSAGTRLALAGLLIVTAIMHRDHFLLLAQPVLDYQIIGSGQSTVDALSSLAGDLELPGYLRGENAVKTGEEFEISEYFSVLNHLSVQPGYILDYVYQYDRMAGCPVVYARHTDEPPYSTYAEYRKERGEASYIVPQYEYMDYVQVDGTAEGFFEFIVLRTMGNQFYLYWHANYNDSRIICDHEALEAIAYASFDWRAAQGFDLEPQVEFRGDAVLIRVSTFTNWGGLERHSYTVSRAFPHQVLWEEVEILVPFVTRLQY